MTIVYNEAVCVRVAGEERSNIVLTVDDPGDNEPCTWNLNDSMHDGHVASGFANSKELAIATGTAAANYWAVGGSDLDLSKSEFEDDLDELADPVTDLMQGIVAWCNKQSIPLPHWYYVINQLDMAITAELSNYVDDEDWDEDDEDEDNFIHPDDEAELWADDQEPEESEDEGDFFLWDGEDDGLSESDMIGNTPGDRD